MSGSLPDADELLADLIDAHAAAASHNAMSEWECTRARERLAAARRDLAERIATYRREGWA